MLKARPSDRPPIQKNGKLKNPISKNKSFNFNKFDYKKLISRLLLFSILLSIIAVFVAPLFINLRVWKPEIVVLLEGITDKKAFIDGDVSLSIFPTPEISVEKVRLVNATGNYDRDFLKLDEIRANITFGSLFRGKVVVEKIKLNGFELFLTENKDGKPNWIERENKLNQEEYQSSTDNNLSSETSDVSLNFENEGFITFADIEINELEFSNGLIIFENNKFSFDLIIEELKIIPTDEINNLITGVLNIMGEEITLSSNFIQNKNDISQLDGLLTLKHKNASIFLDLEIINSDIYPEIIGEFELSSKNFSSFLENLEINSIEAFNYPIKSNGKIKLYYGEGNYNYNLEDLILGLGATNYSGYIRGITGEKPNIEIALSSNSVDLENIDFYITEYFHSSNSEKLNAENDLEVKNIGYWDKLQGSFKITSGTAKLYNYPIRDLTIDFNKKGDNYNIKKASAVFPGNTKINVKGNFSSKLETFEGNIIFDTEDFRSYAKWINFKKINFFPSNRIRSMGFQSELVVRPGASTLAGLKGFMDSSKFFGEMRFRWGEVNNLSASLNFDNLNLDIYNPNINETDLNNANVESQAIEKINFSDLLDYSTEIDLNLKISNSVLYGKTLEGLSYSGNLKDQNIKINNLTVNNFDELGITSSGEINFAKTNPEFNLNLKIYSDSTKFLNYYGLPNKLQNIFSGNFESNLKLKGTKNAVKSDIESKFGDLVLSYIGNINFKDFSFPTLKGDISLRHSDVGGFLDKKIGIKSSLFSGDAEFFAKFYYDINNFNLEKIDFRNNELNYNGSAKIKRDEKEVNYQLDFNFNTMKIEDFLSFMQFTSLYNSKEIKQRSTSGSLKLEIEKFFSKNIRLDKVKIDSILNPKSIEIKNFKADLYGGSISFNSSIEFADTIMTNSQVKLSGVNISDLSKNSMGWSLVNGKIDMKSNIQSNTKNYDQILYNINGKGDFELKDILIEDFNPNALTKLSNKTSSSDVDTAIKDIYLQGKSNIKNISSNLLIENSVMKYNNVPLIFNEVDGDISGNLDFVNNLAESIVAFDLKENSNIDLELIFSGKWNDIKKSSIIKKFGDQEFENENINEFVDDFSDVMDQLIVTENQSVVLQSNANVNNSDPLNMQNSLDQEYSEDAVLEIKLPKFLEKEKILSPSYTIYTISLYSKNNNIIKPQKPTQEDLLDNVLESILD